jgi:hypothetical protein
MTTPTPTPKTQKLPETPDSEETRSADATGFFNRVRRKLKPEEEPIHPTEAAEIVVMDEDSK